MGTEEQPTPPLSLRYPSVNDRTRGPDGPDVLKIHPRVRMCVYILIKNWSVGPTGPLHSCTVAQLFLRLTHARVHIIILEFN